MQGLKNVTDHFSKIIYRSCSEKETQMQIKATVFAKICIFKHIHMALHIHESRQLP